ncbi:hypothetical protein ACEZDB_26950 [Streptacidiphilus sp. N1-3]|uniref:PE family protein n=1 Tax=Streptacidiphilus alkalitolerans TaxID=3342712 RepID=A0ABV6X7L7_9ACTN
MTDSSTPQAAPEQLVLSAHTLSVLARDVAGRLPLNPAGQALAAALEDTAELVDTWVLAQLDALAGQLVAPQVAPVAAPTVAPATAAQPLTATAAVLAATSQLGDGATARNIAEHVATVHALEVSPETVRAIRSKHRRGQAQPEAQPAPQPRTGMYL